LAKEINKKVYSAAYPALSKAWRKVGCHNYQRPGIRLFQPMRRINKLCRQIKAAKFNVLDIGCFNGVLTCVAGRHFKNAVGIDVWKDRIKTSLATRGILGGHQCSFRLVHLKNYIKSGLFDQAEIQAIVATQVLYHLTTTEVDLMIEKLKSGTIKAVVFGTRPGKDYTNNAYDLKDVPSVLRHLIKPYFKHYEVFYEGKCDWPIIVARK